MDLPSFIKDVLEIFQQVEPGLASAVKVGGSLGTVGVATVKVVQKGQKLITYWIERAKTTKATAPVLPPAEKPAAQVAPVPMDEAITTKKHVAILVDINRRALQDVAGFLAQKGMDADLFIVTNDPLYGSQVKSLDERDPLEWVQIVQEFNTAINAVKHAVGHVDIHIFLSTPVALAFGLGCTWGTVSEATVYHWNGKGYVPLMPISRDLRFAKD
jgi:hypothetical protein